MVLFEALVILFVAWVAYTVFAVVDHGLIGFLKAAVDNTAVIQVAVDLVISAVIALGFISGDAKRRGLPFAPYLIATIFTGSIGLLAYLIHRTWRGRLSTPTA